MTPEKKYLKQLVGAVTIYLEKLDELMKQPESYERGRKIAKLSNALEMAKDSARLFGLGERVKKSQPLHPGGEGQTK